MWMILNRYSEHYLLRLYWLSLGPGKMIYKNLLCKLYTDINQEIKLIK